MLPEQVDEGRNHDAYWHDVKPRTFRVSDCPCMDPFRPMFCPVPGSHGEYFV